MVSSRASDLFFQTFSQCSAGHHESSETILCAAPTTLVELVHRDWNAEYLRPPLLPGFGAYRELRQEPAPCARYVAVRRALSTGNYGEALAQLGAVHDVLPLRFCSPLLVLESARLQWFVDEFERALTTLSTIAPEPLPFVYFRARDVIASCVIELLCLKSVGYPLAEGACLRTPGIDSVKDVAEDLSRVARQSAELGDMEAATWAAFNTELATGLVRGRLGKSAVLGLAAMIPRNGRPHALRRAGLAFAYLQAMDTSVELLREACRLAEDLYPMNLIGLKAALNFAWLVCRVGDNNRYREIASNMLRIMIRRFVVSQAALAQTPLAIAVNSVSLHCLNESSDAAVQAPGEADIMKMLKRMPPDIMEKVLARSLVEHVIGPVEILPQNSEWLDLVAREAGSSRHLTYGIQVKSGQTSLLMKDIPAPHILLPHRGFIAIAVKRVGAKAAHHLRLLEKEGIVVHDWTGENLVRLMRRNPSVVALLYRHSLELDRAVARARRGTRRNAKRRP